MKSRNGVNRCVRGVEIMVMDEWMGDGGRSTSFDISAGLLPVCGCIQGALHFVFLG